MPPFPWQTETWQAFVQRVRDDRLAHANLLSGTQGIGLIELAQAMAHFLLCRAPLDEIACGNCRSCKLFAAQSHPDLQMVQVEEGKQQIRIEQIRALNEFVGKTAQMEGWKVIIIYPAEAMNESAVNALLKNLEEPAGQTVFILVSYQLTQLKPTIRSRCLKTLLAPPAEELAQQWLEEQGLSSSADLLCQVGGAPLKALSWFQDGFLDARQDLLATLAAYCVGRATRAQLVGKAGAMDLVQVLEAFLLWSEALIRSASLRQAVPAYLADLATALAPLNVKALYRHLDCLQLMRTRLMQGYNLNSELAIEEFALDWQQLSQREINGN